MNIDNTSFIRTILKDLSPQEAGFTQSHEHIIIDDSFPTATNPLFLLNDMDKIVSELTHLFELGCRTMVDCMPCNCGRNVKKLAEVSRRSGINIIASTGIHLEQYYVPNHWRYAYSEDELTRLFVDDIKIGIDANDYNGPIIRRTSYKAGVIKFATGDENFTLHQEKIIRAVVNTHLETGVPILTHTNSGKHAIDQVRLLYKLGAKLDHVVICHVDKYKDVQYNKELLQMGVKVEYDSAFRWKLKNKENWTYKLLQELLPLFPQQITMGIDAAKHSYWNSYGGNPGLDFLLTVFKRDLNELGMGEYFRNIFIENPADLFSFSLESVSK